LPATARARAVSLAALLAALLAQPAPAEAPFTLRCSGTRSWVAAQGGHDGPSASERVTNYYTFSVRGADAQVYGWHEHAWRSLSAAAAGPYTFAEARQGMQWRLTIGRDDGAWSEVWEGAGRTITITGRCTHVPLRQPPASPPPQ
jgi:hypothetical protein